MRYGQIAGIDKPVSRLIQGTVMLTPDDPAGGHRLLDDVWQLGCTTFDTAAGYQCGGSEQVLGSWIQQRGLRDRVVIVGKGALHDAERRSRVNPAAITTDLMASLGRLETDYIDLYLLHRDDPTVPVGPLVEVLNEHRAAGRIRAFGGSNWTHQRIAEANEFAEARGLVPFVASSPQLSIVVPTKALFPGCISISGRDGADARAWYATTQMAVLAWSSLGAGFFSGRFARGAPPPRDDLFDRLCFETYATEENFQRLDRLRELACSDPQRVPLFALAYVLSLSLKSFAIVGCRRAEHFRMNVEACSLQYAAADLL